jgi:NodT family efflux transporter outer membrane factor (OMF) lipoprotein
MKKVHFLLISIFLSPLLAVTGCSPHGSLMPESQIQIPTAYSDIEIERGSEPPTGRWWEWFEDERLNVLMEKTFNHNLDIAQSYERLRQSQADIQITDSTGGLNINIEGAGGRSRQSGFFRGETGTMGTATFNTYSLSAAASYEIDLWGRLNSKTEAAQLDALAAEEDLKALYISISAQLADLYYLAVEQRAQLELTDYTIDSFKDILERVEHRYREGLVTAVDVYQSRQNLAAARAQRPLFESQLAVTLNAISILTGNFPDSEIGGDNRTLVEMPAFQTGLPSRLLTDRPDIKAAFLRLNAGDKRVASAISDRFPSFNLIGAYGGSGEKISTVLDSPNIFWNILLQAAHPILDAGRRKAEVDRSKSVFREMLALYHKTVLNAFREVEDALAKGNASEARINVLLEQVSASESALRLALDNYMQGLTDYLPVLTTQQRLFDSKSALLSSRRQLISDRIQLARALGGEWTDEVAARHPTSKDKGEKDK